MDGSWYSVLGVKSGAGAGEITAQFKKLSLELHPDKNKVDSPAVANEKFWRLRVAYETLLDSARRTKYDGRLAETRGRVISDEIPVDELEWSGDSRFADCRCGGRYIVPNSELSAGIDLFPCTLCSLSIRVRGAAIPRGACQP